MTATKITSDDAYDIGYAAGAAWDSSRVIGTLPADVQRNAQWGAEQARLDSDSYAAYREEYEHH